MAGVLEGMEAVVVASNSGLLGLGFGLGVDSVTKGDTDGDDCCCCCWCWCCCCCNCCCWCCCCCCCAVDNDSSCWPVALDFLIPIYHEKQGRVRGRQNESLAERRLTSSISQPGTTTTTTIHYPHTDTRTHTRQLKSMVIWTSALATLIISPTSLCNNYIYIYTHTFDITDASCIGMRGGVG